MGGSMSRFAVSLAAASFALVAAAPVAALDDVQRYVFVPNRASADVAIIDTKSDTVVAHAGTGQVPHQVAVSDTLGRLVASNTADDTVTIVDLDSLATVATVTLGHEPEHMEIDPLGETVAIGNIGEGTVSLLSLRHARETHRVTGLYQPHNMTFSPDGRLLYVANLGANLVSVIDVTAGELTNEIAIGESVRLASAAGADDYQGVINVTATPDGRFGFAAYGEGDEMAVIDLGTQAQVATIALGDLPWRAFATADGRYMIVPNNGDETVSIVSTTTFEEVVRLPGAADMTGVNTGWFETTAFVLSRGDDKAVVIDLERLERVGEIALPSTPETGVTTTDGLKLYVALSGSNQVAVIDTRTRALVGLIDDVGEEPWGVHMIGALNYCH